MLICGFLCGRVQVKDVMKKIVRLNTAKTALRKMMELLEREKPGSAVVVRYAGVIEDTLLADMGDGGKR